MSKPPKDTFDAKVFLAKVGDGKAILELHKNQKIFEQGDVAETQAVKNVFGERAAKLGISSTKSMTGHTLGAAGAIESVYTVLAISRGMLPPTINQEVPDPLCDLDYVPNKPRPAKIRIALNNSFGFGGTNTTLAFRPANQD